MLGISPVTSNPQQEMLGLAFKNQLTPAWNTAFRKIQRDSSGDQQQPFASSHRVLLIALN